MDTGTLVGENQRQWCVLMEKWCQGGADIAHAVITKKKPKNRHLTSDEEAANCKITSDGIIFENVFGLLYFLRGLLGGNWK